jgi:hypothetical protein
MKHAPTPGPWRVGNNSVMNGVQILKDYDGIRQHSITICTMPDRGRGRTANARLIAAAPDLLEALERVAHIPCEHPQGGHCTMLSKHSGHECPWCQIRKAITKAKGESHE